jgi:hypothetical protein
MDEEVVYFAEMGDELAHDSELENELNVFILDGEEFEIEDEEDFQEWFRLARFEMIRLYWELSGYNPTRIWKGHWPDEKSGTIDGPSNTNGHTETAEDVKLPEVEREYPDVEPEGLNSNDVRTEFSKLANLFGKGGENPDVGLVFRLFNNVSFRIADNFKTTNVAQEMLAWRDMRSMWKTRDSPQNVNLDLTDYQNAPIGFFAEDLCTSFLKQLEVKNSQGILTSRGLELVARLANPELDFSSDQVDRILTRPNFPLRFRLRLNARHPIGVRATNMRRLQYAGAWSQTHALDRLDHFNALSDTFSSLVGQAILQDYRLAGFGNQNIMRAWNSLAQKEIMNL